MIIKSDNNSTKRNYYSVYEPIDSYVTANIVWTGLDLQYDKIFTKLYNTKPIEGYITYNYCDNYIELLNKIKNKIETENKIPNITIYINKNIKPHDIFLKYFTVIKY